MEWTPLITSAMFDGIRADLLTANIGILSLALVFVGGGILVRVFMR